MGEATHTTQMKRLNEMNTSLLPQTTFPTIIS